MSAFRLRNFPGECSEGNVLWINTYPFQKRATDDEERVHYFASFDMDWDVKFVHW